MLGSYHGSSAPWNRLWMTFSISGKLLIGFGIVTFILLLAVSVLLFEIREIKQFSRGLIQQEMPSAANSQAIARDVYASLSVLQGWIYVRDKIYEKEKKALWDSIKTIVKQNDILSKKWNIISHQVAWHHTKEYPIRLKQIQDQIISNLSLK